MTRVVIELTETVEPASLSKQVERALDAADDSKLMYNAGSFEMTAFGTDVQDPLLATIEGTAEVYFCETLRSHARVIGETRRESEAMQSDEIEPAQLCLTVREFQERHADK